MFIGSLGVRKSPFESLPEGDQVQMQTPESKKAFCPRTQILHNDLESQCFFESFPQGPEKVPELAKNLSYYPIYILVLSC